ncbi:MAG TPA: hypothetical protein VNT51_13105 [Miltoncostaeaceae bacterium]|nr:hypothetical protein [Miltoncostaeaceae bacterium]
MAQRQPQNDREALRAVIVDALGDLRDAGDPHRQAEDIMRALDVYIETTPRADLVPREAPVTDFSAISRDVSEARWTLWLVLGCGVLATVVAAVVLEGGLVAGLVMVAIWVAVLFSLVST